ncbi:MAG: tetratricopeptide repeat protein [Candidatus Muiribacteriota bacterium]
MAENFEDILRQGILYFNSGDFNRALDNFKHAVSIKEDDLNARYNLAVTYFKLGEYSEALKETNMILQIYPTDEATLELLSQIKNQTVEKLEGRIESFPYEEKWYLDLGRIYFLTQNYNKAFDIVNKGIENISESAKLFELRAEIFQKQGDFDEAMQDIEKAFSLAPDDPFIFEKMKDIVKERSKFGASSGSDDGEEVSEVGDYAEKFFVQANNYFRAKRWEEAEEAIKKALRISPNNATYQSRLEEIENARKSSERASELYSDGRQEYRLGRYLRAVSTIEEALSITPNEINYIEASLIIVESYKALKNYEKMIEYCYKILQQDRNNFQIWLYLADGYYLTGNYENAYEYFNKIKEDFGDYLKSYPSINENINRRLRNIRLSRMGPMLRQLALGGLLILALGIVVFYSPFVKKHRNYKKARESFAKKSWSEVVEYLEPVLNYKYGHFKKVEIYKMLISAYIYLRDLDKADELLKEGMKVAGNSEDFIKFYAMIALKRNEFTPEALYAYKVYYNIDKTNIKLLKMIVKYLWARNRNLDFKPVIDLFEQDKIPILEKVFKVDKDNVEVVNLLADEYEKKQIFNKQAIKVFEKLLEFNFENIKVHLLLGKAYVATGKYEAAVKEAKFIFRRDINNSEAHDIFKKSYIAQGNYDQLLIEYENLLQIDPGNMLIIDSIKDLRKMRANYNEDVEEQNPQKEPSNIFKHAQQLFNEGKINESITLFSQLFEESFKKKETGFYLTYAYLKKDLLDLAYKQYKQSDFDEEILPKKMKELIYKLGLKFEDTAQYSKALEMFDKICKVDISYKDVFERYENIALNLEETG